MPSRERQKRAIRAIARALGWQPGSGGRKSAPCRRKNTRPSGRVSGSRFAPATLIIELATQHLHGSLRASRVFASFLALLVRHTLPHDTQYFDIATDDVDVRRIRAHRTGSLSGRTVSVTIATGSWSSSLSAQVRQTRGPIDWQAVRGPRDGKRHSRSPRLVHRESSNVNRPT